MSNWKKGDKALCISDAEFKEMDLIVRPEQGKEYTVRSVVGNYIVLEEFYGLDQWHVRSFSKSLSTILAARLLSGIVDERPEFERTFSLTAKF